MLCTNKAQNNQELSPCTGRLSIVGTPIGNLSDASPRVIETLKTSQLILCEDTRVTAKLTSYFDIHVHLERADEHTIAQAIAPTIAALREGAHISFVSDAGMPGVSDPGQVLVDAVLDAGLSVEVIPGPSACVCALAASGLGMDHFFFEGFLPRKRMAQLERLQLLAAIPGALIIYESPHRVSSTLVNIAEVYPSRRVALVRELTKRFEEVVRGSAQEMIELLGERDELKGECVLVIEGPSARDLELGASGLKGQDEGAQDLEEAVHEALLQYEPVSAAAKRLAKMYHLPRSEVYELLVQKKSQLK